MEGFFPAIAETALLQCLHSPWLQEANLVPKNAVTVSFKDTIQTENDTHSLMLTSIAANLKNIYDL